MFIFFVLFFFFLKEWVIWSVHLLISTVIWPPASGRTFRSSSFSANRFELIQIFTTMRENTRRAVVFFSCFKRNVSHSFVNWEKRTTLEWALLPSVIKSFYSVKIFLCRALCHKFNINWSLKSMKVHSSFKIKLTRTSLRKEAKSNKYNVKFVCLIRAMTG